MSIARDVYASCSDADAAFRITRVLSNNISYRNGLLQAVFEDGSIMLFQEIFCKGFTCVDINEVSKDEPNGV